MRDKDGVPEAEEAIVRPEQGGEPCAPVEVLEEFGHYDDPKSAETGPSPTRRLHGPPGQQ